MSPLADLLTALAGAPSLPGARCRGRSRLFDEPANDEHPDIVAKRQAQALGLCSRCPSLDRCETWFLSLAPRDRPAGVIAGRIYSPSTRNPKGNTA